MNEYCFFYIGMSLLFVHEMNAVRCKEWIIFPFLSKLNEKLSSTIFILAHIPLLLFIFLYLRNTSDIQLFVIIFDVFFIIHLILHLLYLKHQINEFKDWLSWLIIIGIAICGVVDLVILVK